MRDPGARRIPWAILGASIAVALAYSWLADGFRPFTLPMEAAVVLPLLLALTQWPRTPTSRSEPVRPDRVGAAIWMTLAALLVTWELTAFFSSPRHDHPTLSSIADNAMRTHPGRVAVFGLWLLLGWRLFVRPRSRRPGTSSR